jgi:hypothetical protein
MNAFQFTSKNHKRKHIPDSNPLRRLRQARVYRPQPGASIRAGLRVGNTRAPLTGIRDACYYSRIS